MSISEALIEKYRDINVYWPDWHEHIFEGYRQKLLDMGWHVIEENMHYSGFWSQGDGASFTGYCCNLEKFLLAIGCTDENYPFLRMLLRYGGGVSMALTQSTTHYYHENTVALDLEHDDFHRVLPSRDEFRDIIVGDWNDKLFDEMKMLEEDSISFLRGVMRDLYRDLEKEYEYLTTDEVVSEAIIANDLHLDEED